MLLSIHSKSKTQHGINALRVVLLLVATSMINACGFQLRGAVDISQDVAPILIQRNSAFDLAREIKSLLVSNNIAITDNQRSARSELTLLREDKKRRVLSVDSDGRVREYLLSYTVTFLIKMNQAAEKSESLTITRSLLFDPDTVLAVSNEAEILYKDMQRDASRMILLKLQAYSLKREVRKDVSPQLGLDDKPEVIKF